MPDRANEQYLLLLKIDEPVRETPKHAAPISSGELCSRTRIVAHQGCRTAELCDEL